MKRIILIVLALTAACSVEESIKEKKPYYFNFSNGFENVQSTDELTLAGDNSWTAIQKSDPSGKNLIEISSDTQSEGNHSLMLAAYSSQDKTNSNIYLMKDGFEAAASSKVIIEADLFVDTDFLMSDLYLIRLECTTCWDPIVANKQNPFIGLYLTTYNDFLFIDTKGIYGGTLQHYASSFPLQEWVNVKWSMVLSDIIDGENQLTMNDEVLLETRSMNLPNNEIYNSAFKPLGYNFQLQQPVQYNRIKIGILNYSGLTTATNKEIKIYLDNVRITIEN